MKKLSKEQIDSLVVIVVAPSVTFLIDYLLAVIGEQIHPLLVILTYATVLLSYFLMVFIVNSRSKVEEDEKDRYINELKDYITIIQTESKRVQNMILDMESLIEQSRSELLTNDQLAFYEKHIETDEIWVVEHDLYLEANDTSFKETMEFNISRGIKYTFFIPKLAQNVNYIHRIMERLDNPDNVRIYYLGEEYYLLAPNSDYTIYNPNNKHSGEECYMGMTLGNREGAFNAKLSKSETGELIGNLREKMVEGNLYVGGTV